MSEDMDYDLLAHTCSSQEILRVLKEQATEIERLKEFDAYLKRQLTQSGIDLHKAYQFITELADDFSEVHGSSVKCSHGPECRGCRLLREAREAAKHEVKPAGNPDNRSFQGCLDRIRDQDAEIVRLTKWIHQLEMSEHAEIKRLRDIIKRFLSYELDEYDMKTDDLQGEYREGLFTHGFWAILQEAREATKHE